MTIRSTLFAVTLLCLVGFANQVIAQSALAASAPTTEIAVLKAQLESSRQFHDSFVSMVQWAFGTAIAITLLLAAFGWFTNKSNYDRDRLLLSQQVQMIREEIQTAFNERTQTFKVELSAGLSARQSEIETTVRKAIDAKIAPVVRKADEARSMGLELMAAAKLREAESSTESGMLDWAIYEYCQVLEYFVQNETDTHDAGDIFDKINEILKKPEVKFSSDNLTSTVEILNALPRRHATVTESLIPRLKKLLK